MRKPHRQLYPFVWSQAFVFPLCTRNWLLCLHTSYSNPGHVRTAKASRLAFRFTRIRTEGEIVHIFNLDKDFIFNVRERLLFFQDFRSGIVRPV